MKQGWTGETMTGSPVVIFGTGGSGTRVVARIVRHAGCFLGCNLNISDDSLDLAEFFDQQINRYLSRVHWINEVLRGSEDVSPFGPDAGSMVEEFRVAITRHSKGIPDEKGKWGWKEPRTIFLLPFVHREFPNMAAIHVVRDGRDMAYSENQNQLRKHGPSVLRGEEMRLPEIEQSLLLWSRVNLAAAVYAEGRLKGNYLRVRFEELCSSPTGEVERIFEFLSASTASAERFQAAVQEITPAPTLGRWREKTTAEIASLARQGESALWKFGYLQDGK